MHSSHLDEECHFALLLQVIAKAQCLMLWLDLTFTTYRTARLKFVA
jgi:hypothetical protein